MKRMLSIILALTLVWCSSPYANAATVQQNNAIVDNGMDTIDLLVAAFMHMYSADKTRNLWPDEVIVERKIPLFSPDGKRIAWYVEFTSGAYAIINDNKENPSVIEFGSQPNMLIRDIYDSSDAYHIIYNGPMQVYNAASTLVNASRAGENNDLYSNYPDLEESNPLLASTFSDYSNAVHNMLKSTVMPRDSYEDYGFISWEDLPQQNCTYGNLPYVDGISWAITSDYVDADNPSYAYNHCGAVCVTNLAIYFSQAGRPELMIAGDKDATFHAVHCHVPNGPVGSIKNYAYDYFYDCGYVLRYSSLSTFTDITNAINAGRPCALLLSNEVFDWHWIMVVGWIVYGGTQQYARIVTGWDYSASYYYRFNSSSLAFSGEQYWIG